MLRRILFPVALFLLDSSFCSSLDFDLLIETKSGRKSFLSRY